MATSGSTNWSLTAQGVATFALRKLRILAAAEVPLAEDMALCLEALNAMLKSWQMTGPHLWRETEGSLALTSATQSYAIPAAYRIVSARFRQSGRDLPMELLGREDYYDLPLKSSSGIPTSYYFDPQRASGTLYVWPVLATAAGETIQYTYQRRFEDIDNQSDDLDVPQEWLETVGYALAARLRHDFGKEVPGLVQDSEILLARARMSTNEPVIRFEPERRWR